MKKKTAIFLTALFALSLVSCEPETTSQMSISANDVNEYMDSLSSQSQKDHLYLHYLRHDNTPSSYQDWDIWAWNYRPFEGQGAKFDWVGRSTSSDKLSATGNATIDNFGGAYVDIDLRKTYDGGWDNSQKTIGGTSVSYLGENGELAEQIGVQIVKSEDRVSGSGYWGNDGGNQYITLEDFALTNADGSTSYHVFFVEDMVEAPSRTPHVSITDPFLNDDGSNVTYGDDRYNNVNWNEEGEIPETSPLFLKGTGAGEKGTLNSGAGVGYQIMVSSFADSDGDGFGDIYGIINKLDYLEDLGVEVLWLTPIQLSDSYHGYDISDYTQVDPKFGSKVSPNAIDEAVTAASAMEDYKDLLEEAHKRGMAVVMDLVLNHTSTSNVWFMKSANLDEDYRGFYQWGNHETNGENISEEKYWYPYGDHAYSFYAKFGSGMPELNYSYVSTREAVTTMTKQWCEIGVDGFRIDAVKHIFMNDEVEKDKNDTIILDISKNKETGKTQDYSSNLTKNLQFWRSFIQEVKKDYPNTFFVGENFDGHAYHVAPFYEGFDSMFDFYSYYNITNAAANALNPTIGGPITNWNGLNPGTVYSSSSDTDPFKGVSGNVSSSGAIAYGGTWDFKGVIDAYQKYRSGGKTATSQNGYDFIGGSFTSNHDISRVINRIAGSKGEEGNDIAEQGKITKDNYSYYLDSATLVMLSEIFLPGLTWVYYGDELGMTGNYKGENTSQSGYADLAYRQPMKWKQNAKVGDGSYMTGYGISGAENVVEWDEVNASSLVPSVEEKENSEHFKAIREALRLKASSATLTRGIYTPIDWKVNNSPANYVFHFTRQLGSEIYEIIINFSPNVTLSAGFKDEEVVFTYKGATKTSIPPRSALVLKQ